MTIREHISALYQEGKKQREIARIIGISQPAVRKHLLKLNLLAPLTDDSLPPIEASNNQQGFHVLVEGEQKEVGTVSGTLCSQIPKGAIHCGICKGVFLPSPLGAKYCCNACGARAAGYNPVADHTADCLRLIDNH